MQLINLFTTGCLLLFQAAGCAHAPAPPPILSQDFFDLKDAPPNPDLSSRQEMIGTFDKRTVEARKLLAAATDEQLMKPWSLKVDGKTLFTAPRIAILRDNIRQITEQATSQSGAADEERNADRLARQTEELDSLLKEQERRLADR